MRFWLFTLLWLAAGGGAGALLSSVTAWRGLTAFAEPRHLAEVGIVAGFWIFSLVSIIAVRSLPNVSSWRFSAVSLSVAMALSGLCVFVILGSVSAVQLSVFYAVQYAAVFAWKPIVARLVKVNLGVISGGLSDRIVKLGHPRIRLWPLTDPGRGGLPTDCDGVVVDVLAPGMDRWATFLSDCRAEGIPVHTAGNLFEKLTGQVSLVHVAQELAAVGAQRRVYALVKRVADVLLTLLALPVAFLPMVLTALAIRLESAGPVIFKQTRLGESSRPFTMYKFRSMHDGSDKGTPQTARHGDERITQVGRLIRKFRLDELPQFWNILAGDMSLIGPRPEQVELARHYSNVIPGYEYRCIVKPGITGWAQVMTGYAGDEAETARKVVHDLYYIRHYSLWLDALIAVKTLKIVLTGFGAR